MRIIFSFLLLGFFINTTPAFSQAGQWAFSVNSGIDFNTTPPIKIITRNSAFYQSTGVCDCQGKLSLYGYCQYISNKFHEYIMDTTGGLYNVPFHHLGITNIMIKSPKDPKYVYFISSFYSVKPFPRKNGLGYTLFDLTSKNDSASFVDTIYKRMLYEQSLTNQFKPSLSYVKHRNGKFEWLITEYLDSLVGKKFFSHLVTYLIDSTGINPTPVHSNIQFEKDTLLFPLLQIKSAHDGKSLAISGMGDFSSLPNSPSTIICDFNNETGEAYNPRPLLIFKDHAKCITTGIEFSPNDSLIYVSTTFDYLVQRYFPKINLDQETAIVKNYLYQINRYTGDKQIVQTFKKKNPYGSHINLFSISGLQLGGDNKIYFNFSDTNMAFGGCRDMGVIHRPNVVGPSCHIDLKYFHFDEPLSAILPNWARPKNQLSFTSNLFYSPCYDTAEFIAVADSNYKSIIWYFGDGDSLVWKNKEWHASPVVKHTYRNSGTYYVKIRGEKDECEYAMWYGDSLFITPKLRFNEPKITTEPLCNQTAILFTDTLIDAKDIFIGWGDGTYTNEDIGSNSRYSFRHATKLLDTLNITVRIRNTFCQDSMNLKVVSNPLPTILSALYLRDTFTICAGNTFTFKDTFSLLKSRRIDWGSGFQSVDLSGDLYFQFKNPGIHTVRLADSSIFDCSVEDSFIVHVTPGVIHHPMRQDTFGCNGSQVRLQAGTNYAPLESYHWADLNKSISLGTDSIITVKPPCKILSVVQNICGIFSDTLEIKDYSEPSLFLDSIYAPCQGKALTVIAGDLAEDIRFRWSTADTGNKVHITSSGQYWVSAFNGCGADTAFFNVQFIPKPEANFHHPDVCEGSVFKLIQSGKGGKSFLWRLGDGTVSTDSTAIHIYPLTGQARTYLVTLLAAASKDCADSITLPVNVLVAPIANFTHSSNGRTVFFSPDQTPSGASWQWHFGDGDSSTLSAPSHTYKADSGTYTVCLTVTNAENCTQKVCKQVHFSVGITELNRNIKIYPNPADHTLYIESSSELLNGLTLTDLNGRILYRTNVYSNLGRIDVSGLSKGLYLLTIQTEKGSWQEKIEIGR